MRKPIHTAAEERFLALLKGARKAAGLTQAEVSGRLFENGERRLDVLEFVAVCRAIEADAVEIVLSSPRTCRMPARRSRKSGRAG